MKLPHYILLFIVLSLAACTNEPDWPDTIKEDGARYSNFDFRGTFDCPVTLNLGQRDFVYIYTEDPSQNANAEVVRTLWTDGNGHYECTLTLPTALLVKSLYAFTSNGLISATVTENGVSFRGEKARSSRNADDELIPSIGLCVDIKNNYLAKMPRLDKENLNKLVETGEIAIRTKEDNSHVVFTYLHSFGWNSNYIYYYYYKGEDPITPDNKEQYIEKICSDRRFLCTRGWGIQVNSKGAKPKNPDYDNITVLTESGLGGINLRFCDVNNSTGPGTIEGDWAPHDNSMIGISNPLYFYGDISLETNEYLYDYEDRMPFPKGYKIGLILKSVDSEIRENLTDPNYAIPSGKVNYFFSNPKLNAADAYSGNKVHVGRFWSSDEANDISRFVYGFEDSMRDNNWQKNGSDYNFTDFLCMVSTNPAAYTADVTSLMSTYSSVSGTLLFEDLFPDQGDYDMNDVIVEYRKVKEFETKEVDGVEKDCIRNLYIEITPVHYGATYDNYIYVNVNPNNGCNILPKPQLIDFQSEFGRDVGSVASYNERQIQSGSPTQLKTATLYLIKDWAPYGQPDIELTLTDTDVPFSDIEAFIYVRNTNREVHVTNNVCVGVNGSSNDDLSENLKSYKAQQAQDGSFLPWAIDIPIKSDSHGYRGFIPVSESIKITDEYISFFDWFNGDKSKAWYENKYHTPVISK